MFYQAVVSKTYKQSVLSLIVALVLVVKIFAKYKAITNRRGLAEALIHMHIQYSRHNFVNQIQINRLMNLRNNYFISKRIDEDVKFDNIF